MPLLPTIVTSKSPTETYWKISIPADRPIRQFPKSDFVVAIGDIDPVKRTFQIFREIMGPEMPFIPVRGNHEAPEDVRFIIKDILPSEKPAVTVYDQKSATFYFDWKNVRLIVIDQYAPYAKGLSGAPILKWVENAIVSAKKADHVFISFHEPQVCGRFLLGPVLESAPQALRQGHGGALRAFPHVWQAACA